MADSIHTRITKARKAAGLKQNELASVMGVKPQAVNSWEKGKTRPKAEHLAMLVTVLRTTFDYLHKGIGPIRDGDAPSIISVDNLISRDVPLFSLSELVAASIGRSEKNNNSGGLKVRALAECSIHAKAFEMADDSMEPVFHKTDIIIIDPEEPYEPGDYVAVYLPKEDITVFRQFKYDGPDHCVLAALNSHHRSYRFPIAQMDADIRVLGSYVEHTVRKRRKSHT